MQANGHWVSLRFFATVPDSRAKCHPTERYPQPFPRRLKAFTTPSATVKVVSQTVR
jgi:hypothetical protein